MNFHLFSWIAKLILYDIYKKKIAPIPIAIGRTIFNTNPPGSSYRAI